MNKDGVTNYLWLLWKIKLGIKQCQTMGFFGTDTVLYWFGDKLMSILTANLLSKPIRDIHELGS